MNNTFITLTELGKIYGVSAREAGKWLKGLNLRHQDGAPSQEAIDQGFVLERELRHGGSFWLWHKEKTVNVLDARGGSVPVAEQHEGFVLVRGGGSDDGR